MNSLHLATLEDSFQDWPVKLLVDGNKLRFASEQKELVSIISDEGFDFKKHAGEMILPLDFLVREPKKIAAAIVARLGLNHKLFARNCKLQKVTKKAAAEFLDQYHLMNSTQSAFNYGLFYSDDLVALASFSKGRKMNRLTEDKRSFELIRFCCKPGITVTGGLTKLLKNFCEEKQAGDIMTYVDKQWSDGSAFLKAGFKKHGESDPTYFLINKNTLSRQPIKPGEEYDSDKFYRTENKGNLKFIYTPGNL